MAKNDSDNEELKSFVHQLYNDQETVRSVLSMLDTAWKSGEDVHERFDNVIHRYKAIRVFFYYLVRRGSNSEKANFLRDLNLEGTVQADFLNDLAERYFELDNLFKEFVLSRHGAVNHLTQISVEGVFYSPQVQSVQASFSIYSFRNKLIQVRDDVDDFIWLAEGIVEVINRAIQECLEKNSPISTNYTDILQNRFSSFEEDFQELRDLLSKLKGDSSYSLNQQVSADDEEYDVDD